MNAGQMSTPSVVPKRSHLFHLRHPPAELQVNPEIPDGGKWRSRLHSSIAVGKEIEHQIQHQHIQNQAC